MRARLMIGAVLALCAAPANAADAVLTLDGPGLFSLLLQDCLVTNRASATARPMLPGGPLDRAVALDAADSPADLPDFERLAPLTFHFLSAAPSVSQTPEWVFDEDTARPRSDSSVSVRAMGTLDVPAFFSRPRQSIFDTMLVLRIDDGVLSRPTIALKGGVGAVMWQSAMIVTGRQSIRVAPNP